MGKVSPFNVGINSLRATLPAKVFFLPGILIFKVLTTRRLYKSFGVKGLIDKWGFLKNTAISRQLMRTARKLEAELGQVLRRRLCTGAKEDESSTGRVWVAGLHHVTTRSRLAGVLKLMKHLFL
jgi:hypothetical protein